MQKAAEAFRTISEVAEDLDVPKHVLRFWEARFAQLKPMKRGGGRRYYRPEDLDLLRGIRHLLYERGFTIKGAQRILREQGLEWVKTCWRAGAAASPSPGASGANPAVQEAGGAKSADQPAKRGAAARKIERQPLSLHEVQELRRAVEELTQCRSLLSEAAAGQRTRPRGTARARR